MTIEKADVVIIGGGVAGLTLAKYLAEENIDFILFEEHNDFFQKACGEAIILKMADYNFFDLYESKKGIERTIYNTVISTKYGEIDLYMPYLTCSKKLVEKELARQVLTKDGKIVMDSRVESITNTRDSLLVSPQNIRAKIVVGADGVNSPVRKFMGLTRPPIGIAASGIHPSLEKSPEKLYTEVKKDVARLGYSWFFPKKNSWNIGIGSAKHSYFIEGFNKFKKRFPEVKEWKVNIIPLSKPIKSYSKNTILVGDSAAQVFAVNGSGILSAMICAKIAADKLIEMAKDNFRNIDLSLYEKAWKDKLYKEFVNAYNFYRLLRIGDISEYIFHIISKQICGKVSTLYRK